MTSLTSPKLECVILTSHIFLDSKIDYIMINPLIILYNQLYQGFQRYYHSIFLLRDINHPDEHVLSTRVKHIETLSL